MVETNSHCNGHCHGHCTVTVTCMGKSNSHCSSLKRFATIFSGPAREVGDGAWRGGAINMKSELIVAAGSRLGSLCFQIERDSMAFFRVRFLRNKVQCCDYELGRCPPLPHTSMLDTTPARQACKRGWYRFMLGRRLTSTQQTNIEA